MSHKLFFTKMLFFSDLSISCFVQSIFVLFVDWIGEREHFKSIIGPSSLNISFILILSESVISSSFIYDNYNTNFNYDYDYEYDTQYSDFISDQRYDKEIKYRYAPYTKKSHFSAFEEREITSNIRPTASSTSSKIIEQKLPAMEMTIDLKSPPTMDVPLRNISVQEGHVAKLECIVSGELDFKKWSDCINNYS